MTFKLGASLLLLTICIRPSQATALPAAFSATQGAGGIFYEQIGDTRATNTLNPGLAGTSQLSYIGVFAFSYPGVVAVPTYASVLTQNYPNLGDDSADGAIVMSPGTGGVAGTSNIGVDIEFQASTAGLYNLTGMFARDNANIGAGDGVDVLVIKGSALNSPLFSAHISQNNAVDYTHPFAGSGVAQFNLNVSLVAGDSLRFIVFSGPQGQDGGYDNTAFRVNIGQVPEPASIVLFGIGTIGVVVLAHRRRRGRESKWHRRFIWGRRGADDISRVTSSD